MADPKDKVPAAEQPWIPTEGTRYGRRGEGVAMSEAQLKLHAVRFPKLDTESLLDFVAGFKASRREYGNPQTDARRNAFLQSIGMPTGETDLSPEECHRVLLRDPVYQAEIRFNRSIQEVMWDRSRRAFENDSDRFLAEMEATDKSGPGTLELNPNMEIPEYTRYEIHEQPGGYVGNPFAGHLYHYALNKAFYHGLFRGEVEHDEPHEATAARLALPADGKVNRILEIGCSDGRTTIAIKERFPKAEVWGIDIGGPMVRYAHHRASKMGIEVHFAQRLAEDSKFPDNHFDVVIDNLLFHEVTPAAAVKIVKEMHRVMRPGAVWDHNDVPTAGHPKVKIGKTIVQKAAYWVNHRYNHEPWQIMWRNTDFPSVLKAAGFMVDLSVPKINAIKSA